MTSYTVVCWVNGCCVNGLRIVVCCVNGCCVNGVIVTGCWGSTCPANGRVTIGVGATTGVCVSVSVTSDSPPVTRVALVFAPPASRAPFDVVTPLTTVLASSCTVTMIGPVAPASTTTLPVTLEYGPMAMSA